MTRAARLLLPRLGGVESRFGHDLAGGAALRLLAGAFQCRNRRTLRGPGPRPGAPQPRWGRLHRSHRRPPHHARLLLRGGRGRPLVHLCARLLDAAWRADRPHPLARSVLAGDLGHGEATSGVLLGLRAAGSILASLLAARFVRSGPQTLWPVVCGLAVAAAIGFVPTVNHVVPIAFWMLVVGAGTAAMTLYFQITISEASTSAERGSALALGGLGWSVSHLSTPLLMGLLADKFGIVVGFYVLGGFALASALLIAGTRRWAFRAS